MKVTALNMCFSHFGVKECQKYTIYKHTFIYVINFIILNIQHYQRLKYLFIYSALLVILYVLLVIIYYTYEFIKNVKAGLILQAKSE